MQSVDYYTGSQIDMDNSDQFMINARDVYKQQQMVQPQANPYFTYGENSYGTSYQGPGPGSNLEFYQGNNLVGQQYIPQNNMPGTINGLHYNMSGTNMGYQNQNGYLQAPNQIPIMNPQGPLVQNIQQPVQMYTPMQNFVPNPQFYGYRDSGPGIVTYSNPSFNGLKGNPAIEYIEQRQMQAGTIAQPITYNGIQQPQGQVVHVNKPDPLGGSKYLFTSDVQDQLDQMQVDMVIENQEAIAKREEQARILSGSYLNNNYIGGISAYNANLYGGLDPQIYNKYKTKVQELVSQAEERRNKFNKNLSMLVHNWLGDGVTEEQVDKQYQGYTYTIPQEDIYFAQAQQRFDRLVPINTAPIFWAHDAAVTAEFRKYCPDGRNLNEFLNDATMIRIKDAEEEEAHRRCDGKLHYDQDIMHHYIKKYARERNIDDSGIDYSKASKGDIMKHLMGKDNLEDLQKSGITITDDGHFEHNIDWDSAPEGIKKTRQESLQRLQETKLRDPSPVSSRPSGSLNGPVINNENVKRYEQNRSKFFQSIMDTGGPKINHEGGNQINLANISPPTGGG